MGFETHLEMFSTLASLNLSQAPASQLSVNVVNTQQSNGQKYSNSNNRGNYRNHHNNNNNRGRGCIEWGRGRNNSGRPICQVCGIAGHIAIKCYHRFDQDYQSPYNRPIIVAIAASLSTVVDSNWYMDGGAINHVAMDPSMVPYNGEYKGKDKLFVGNGQSFGEGSTKRET